MMTQKSNHLNLSYLYSWIWKWIIKTGSVCTEPEWWLLCRISQSSRVYFVPSKKVLHNHNRYQRSSESLVLVNWPKSPLYICCPAEHMYVLQIFQTSIYFVDENCLCLALQQTEYGTPSYCLHYVMNDHMSSCFILTKS